jgi:hypothetical protein
MHIKRFSGLFFWGDCPLKEILGLILGGSKFCLGKIKNFKPQIEFW